MATPNAGGRPEAEEIALVHDYLLAPRGAERTFAAMCECWPSAPVYTLLYDASAMADLFAKREIRTSPLQSLGASQDWFRHLLPLYPVAAEQLVRGEHRLVISSSSAFAHGVRVRGDAVHICYCHSPFRYAWHERGRALEEVPRWQRRALAVILEAVRRWDLCAASRVTHYIANSRLTQERIGRFYGRDAPILHPPVSVDRFKVSEPEDYFLYVGEITRHKLVERAIEAALRAGVRMVVVGSGPELARLRALYGERIEFKGRVDDDQLVDLVARARAQVVPNVEEFGIAAVEAQAAGRPVVAARGGGALETVVDGETGVLVDPESTEALAEALRCVDFESFDPMRARANAQRFSVEAFQTRLRSEVARLAEGATGPDGDPSSEA